MRKNVEILYNIAMSCRGLLSDRLGWIADACGRYGGHIVVAAHRNRGCCPVSIWTPSLASRGIGLHRGESGFWTIAGARPMALDLIATRISRSALAPGFPRNSE